MARGKTLAMDQDSRLWSGIPQTKYRVSEQPADEADQAFKFCLSTCLSNSCSGPTSVVEKEMRPQVFDHSTISYSMMHFVLELTF